MHGLSKLATALGWILLLVGVAVFVIMIAGGISGEEMDAAYGIGQGLGLISYLEPAEQLWLMLGHHRFTLLIVGLALIVVGRVTARKQ